MCIAALAIDAHPRWALVVAANRDEYHARPSAPLARWGDGTIAGRDLVGGGTWLGIHEAGRLVLVTNYRVPGHPKPDRPSRGALVTDLLNGADPQTVLIASYNPFNLICVGPAGGILLNNYPTERREPLAPGIHGVSNGAFDPPWPKTLRLWDRLGGWLSADTDDFTPLFAALADETPGEVSADGPEARLSSIFVRDPAYGTRCSTVVAVDRSGAGRIVERRFDANGKVSGESELTFRWG